MKGKCSLSQFVSLRPVIDLVYYGLLQGHISVIVLSILHFIDAGCQTFKDTAALDMFAPLIGCTS